MNLGNFKVAHKMLAVIGLLSLVACLITAAAVLSLKSLSEAASEMDLEAKDEVLAALIGQNALELNRAEFRVAADPSQQNVEEARRLVVEQRRELEERLKEARGNADDEQVKLLDDLEKSYRTYVVDLEATLTSADVASTQVAIGEAQRSVLNAATTSSAAVAKLEATSQAYIDYTAKIADHLAEEAEATYETASMAMIIGALLGIAIGLAAGWTVSQKGIVSPIRRIVDCLRALADGKLDTAVFGSDRRDEVGEIAHTTQVFKDNLIAAEKMRAQQEEERKAKERRQTVVSTAVATFEKAMTDVVRTVSSASTELQSAAQAMSSTAERTSTQAAAVATAADQAAASVQTVAAATEELAASVKEIGMQVDHSKNATTSAVEEASQTTANVEALAEASNKIGDVVRLINAIASQTNLLALNATIEAARAGEMGKGFAVVAGEVKSLAAQTAHATDEIAQQINGIQTATKTSVEAIGRITGTIRSINGITTAIAAAVEQQGAATHEIARNVQQAATGTTEVTRNVAGVSQAAGETGSAAAQVLAAAGDLSKQSETLRQEFEEFVSIVRAA